MSQERPFPSNWLARCSSPEDRAEFKQYLSNSRRIFDELEYLLGRIEDDMVKQETDYTDAAWAYKQAHYNGMRDMLSRVKKLIP